VAHFFADAQRTLSGRFADFTCHRMIPH
jgi:hypothetical protein